MPSLLAEHLLTVPAAAKRLRKHRDTIRSWMRRGLLDWVELPSGQHTSVEAIARMTARLAAKRRAEWKRGDSLPSASANERAGKRAHKKALKVLKRMGAA